MDRPSPSPQSFQAQPSYSPLPPAFPPPPRKRKVWPWVLGGVAAFVLIMFVGCVALVGTAVKEASDAPGPKEPAVGQAGNAIGLNSPARDGKFEFIVTKVEPGPARIGTELLGESAQGKFLLVYVTVKNIGNEAQFFSGDSQKLYDAQGREFSADTAAAIYLDQSQSFLNEVNPGNAVNGIVVFDVPKDVAPIKIELHDSAFSVGVTVSLG